MTDEEMNYYLTNLGNGINEDPECQEGLDYDVCHNDPNRLVKVQIPSDCPGERIEYEYIHMCDEHFPGLIKDLEDGEEGYIIIK